VHDNEKQAVDHARALLSLPNEYDEVKVVRQRSLFAGFTTETSIFQQKKPDAKDRPLHVSKVQVSTGVCATVDDLYTFETRIAVARLFRSFLERFKITATELLHGYPYMRKLSEAGPLINTAIQQVGRTQAEGGKAKERVMALETLVNQGIARARDFVPEKKKLKFNPADLAATSQCLLTAVGPDRHDYAFLSLLTDHLQGSNSVAGRVDVVLDLMRDDQDAAALALLEGVVADALTSAELVKEMLGPHQTLGDSLCALADLLHYRKPGPYVQLSPMLVRIGELMQAGKAPFCRVILIERLRQAVSQDQPLDKRDPTADGNLLKELAKRLKDDGGRTLGGSMVEKALADRAIRQRQALLRAQGIDYAADALPQHYQPSVN